MTAPKKILVIEDEEGMAQTLESVLMNAGHEVRVASDAMLGIQQAHRFKPHLIILDMMLPAGGGLSVLKNIKQSLHTRAIPVLVLTASQDEEIKKKALQFGVTAYIQKPCSMELLRDEVQKLFNGGEPGRVVGMSDSSKDASVRLVVEPKEKGL